MIKSIRRRAAAACMIAGAALAPVQIAHAQQQAQAGPVCVSQDDLTDAVIYAMPVLTDSFRAKCSAELPADGFMATRGDAFVAPYVERQDASWPGTARVLTVFATRKDGSNGGSLAGLADLFETLDPETARPFVDAVIGTMIAKELKLEDCTKVERGIALLAPLPPENVGGLVTFIMDLADVKNPELCPLEQQ